VVVVVVVLVIIVTVGLVLWMNISTSEEGYLMLTLRNSDYRIRDKDGWKCYRNKGTEEGTEENLDIV